MYVSNSFQAPSTVRFLTPVQSHMIAFADIEDANAELVAINWEQRDIIFLPVNDASLRRGQEGRHWSLLVLLRSEEGVNAGNFTAILFDSASLPSHIKRSQLLVKKILGDTADLQIGTCAQQINGFDCGIYVLIFAEIILQAYSSHTAWFHFRVATSWQRQLRGVSPNAVTDYRRELRGLYQQSVDRDRNLPRAPVVAASSSSSHHSIQISGDTEKLSQKKEILFGRRHVHHLRSRDCPHKTVQCVIMTVKKSDLREYIFKVRRDDSTSPSTHLRYSLQANAV